MPTTPRIKRTTPPSALPHLLSPEEVAAFTGLRLAHVYELVRRGELPAVKFGRRVRVPASAVTGEATR